jgi:hypothetical protein
MKEQHPAHSLKAAIDLGLANLAEGRVQDFDVFRIIGLGRERHAVSVLIKVCDPSDRDHDSCGPHDGPTGANNPNQEERCGN